MIKRKLYLDQIGRLIDKEPIKIITGVRRSGKTYLLKSISSELKDKGVADENILLISFESMKYNKIENFKQLDECIVNLTQNINGKIYFLFDEIQNVKNWEKSINSYRVDFDCDIYITGSNSELLSGELATLISGRYFQINIYPFSFSEFIQYKKEIENIDVSNLNELFGEYVKFGGMPPIQQIDKQDKYSYLDDIYGTLQLKDIITRHNIRNSDMLSRILDYVIMNLGKNFSATNIAKYMKHDGRKISKDTILDYLLYSKNACFIHQVQREDIKGKKVLLHNEKYYLVDHGFYQAKYGGIENIGSILENIVYIELLRRGYDIKIGFFNEKEIDFVCTKGNEKIYVQVTYKLSGDETIEREFSGLLKINDNFDKYVLSMDTLDFSTNGLKHRNIIDFLISDYI
ncbi:ATP-binding protein [uncultured Methanobrevibacter sp.]|uniref:ATP-binding protein n=1 Tax=uncultured Methanobrevibacter sp. TaxID=253161 RepID=UPI0025E2A7B0|nr:ATP-binding protein [uncultured Methanobrevibacter sp.]MCI6994593.1 ATP-binding protein [Methanobrevibacter sp.]